MDKIKQKIQELCPDVMELKMGCRYRAKGSGLSYEAVIIGKDASQYHIEINENRQSVENYDTFKRDFIEILGSPITLAVVLRAIDKGRVDSKEHGYSIRHTGRFYRDNLNSVSDVYVANWNLSQDSYDLQSEETKQFIGTLLGVPLKGEKG